MANGRCRMHGGLSTGPRTSAGLEKCRTARLKHGRYAQNEYTRLTKDLKAIYRMVQQLTEP